MLETIKTLEKGNLKPKLNSIIYNFVSKKNCLGINIYIDAIDIFFKHKRKVYQIGSVSFYNNKIYINVNEANGGECNSFELVDLEESVIEDIYIDLAKQIYISCSVYKQLDSLLYFSMSKYICNFTTKNDNLVLGFSSTQNSNYFKVVFKKHTPKNIIKAENKHHGYPVVMDVYSKKKDAYLSTEEHWSLIEYMFSSLKLKTAKLDFVIEKIEKFNVILNEFIDFIKYNTLDNVLYDYKKYLDYLILRYYDGSYEYFVREIDFKFDGKFIG